MGTLCLQDSWRNYTRLVKGYLWIPVFCSDPVQLYNEESRGDTVPKWWDRSTDTWDSPLTGSADVPSTQVWGADVTTSPLIPTARGAMIGALAD
jgi:hypothetical protein